MRREGAKRLAVVAGSVLACALASLPFAGTGGDRLEAVWTIDDGRDQRAATVVPPPPSPLSVQLAEAAANVPLVEPVVAAPVDTGDIPPPPPPPPPGADLDPSVGVVPGDAPADTSVAVAAPPPPSPPPSPSSTGAVTTSAPGERVWAVVVGIDDYPGTDSDLRAAVNDARDLVTALVGFGVPGDHVRVLYNRSATIDTVLDAVEWLVANAGPEDTAVFLYAGHVRDLGGGTEAIVTADAGWITDWFLADRFARLRARDAWFVLAACFGGGFDELLGPNRVLTAAAGPGQLAYENDSYGRSYLAEFVLRRGLVEGAAGEPTVQAAVGYGVDQLRRQHPDRQLWHADRAGRVISLDGVRRDGSAQPGAPPPPPPPEDANIIVAATCLLGLCSGSG